MDLLYCWSPKEDSLRSCCMIPSWFCKWRQYRIDNPITNSAQSLINSWHFEKARSSAKGKEKSLWISGQNFRATHNSKICWKLWKNMALENLTL
jgi:hypothetical protein